MIQGTTPTIAFAFPIEIESLKEFDLTIQQEGKADLTKEQKDFEIDTENNVAYTKLSQEETRAFDPRKYVKMQINAVTLDNNVIASQIITDHICPNLKKTDFDLDTTEITPIDITTFELDFTQNSCGFNIGFGDMIVYEERPADKQLSSTSTNAVENRVVTENFARVDNQFIETDKRADEIEAIARGASKGKVYTNYYEMVGVLNQAPKDFLRVPDHIYITDVGVPDLWVAFVENSHLEYRFTGEEDFIGQLKLHPVQVGYFSLSMLETQKVDLTDYAKKEQVPVVTATLKENGAYTLTITMGVD